MGKILPLTATGITGKAGRKNALKPGNFGIR